MISEEPHHLLFRLDVFRSGVTKSFFVGDQFTRQDTEQGIVRLNILFRQIMGIVGRNQIDIEFLRNARNLDIDDAILR